jgi:hypothetical protein
VLLREGDRCRSHDALFRVCDETGKLIETHPTRRRFQGALTQAGGCVVLSRYTTDGVGDALPVVPFTFRNERVERFENFLLTESRHEVFQIVLDLSSYRCSKLRSNL